jgi:glycosyltransferase involved in cell wall biosynthesis
MALNVCMIISNFYPVLGGAEIQAFRLSQKLVKKGLNVDVVTRHQRGLKFSETIEGVNIHRMPCFGGLISKSLTYTLFGLLWIVYHRKKVDVLHCHQALSPTTIGVLAKQLIKKGVLVKLTATDLYGDVYQISILPFKDLRKRLLGKVDYFIIMNEIMQRQLELMGIRDLKTKTIFNGVDISVFHPVNTERKNLLRKKLMLPEDSKLVIFTGRLETQKDLSTLIKAWDIFKIDNNETHMSFRLTKKDENVIPAKAGIQSTKDWIPCQARNDRKTFSSERDNSLLLIVGEGSQKKEIESLIEKSRFKHSIKILGYRSNIRDYLQASDCFVLPSVDEGISNSLLEAMACGLPPIVTKVGSNPEVVEHLNSGILVESRDSESLGKAISFMLSNEQMRRYMGRSARERVENKYSLDRTVEDYLELYNELISHGC